eukprot:16434863-Heterocapsa_arctica.AAC.2
MADPSVKTLPVKSFSSLLHSAACSAVCLAASRSGWMPTMPVLFVNSDTESRSSATSMFCPTAALRRTS